MSIKAFFVDFYGTVVHEDGAVIKTITQIIFDTGNVEDKGAINRAKSYLSWHFKRQALSRMK